MSLRELLAAKAKAPPVLVPVPTPELGDDCPQVWGKRMDGREWRDFWTEALRTEKVDGEQKPVAKASDAVLLAVFAMTDEGGKRLWSMDDLATVQSLPGCVVSDFWAAVAPLNKLLTSDREDAKKNSEVAEGGCSVSTGLPGSADGPSGNCLTDTTPSS